MRVEFAVNGVAKGRLLQSLKVVDAVFMVVCCIALDVFVLGRFYIVNFSCKGNGISSGRSMLKNV